MPIDKNKYPANWKDISYRIRTERAGNKCEWCGAPNGQLIYRDKEHPEQFEIVPVELSETEFYRIFGGKPISEMSRVIKVMLTVAHINHNTTDNDDSNLAALCQRCHLTHDAKYHAGNAKITRQKAKLAALKAAGQLPLIQEDE